jgi:hypothetical protein
MAKPNPFDQAAQLEGMSGVMLDLAKSIYFQESSGGKNTKTSNAGAVGGMQVMPATFKGLADKGWVNTDPVHNARAGMRLIKQLHAANGGDPSLTAVGYYGGQGAVNKARNGEAVSDPRNPNAPDTFRYSDEVLARMPNNETYTRLVRAGGDPNAIVNTAKPSNVVAQPPALDIPANIPAYHGIPDQWSNFGRALPQTPITPEVLRYGKQSSLTPEPQPQGETQAIPMPSYEVDPRLFAQYMPKSNQPIMQAFTGWGSPV